MATEVKYLSDTWRMIRNCEISPQRAREEVRFLINLIDARIAAAKARGRYADIDDAFNEQPAPTKDFVDHLKRRAEREPAVKAALESRDEQPAPAPAKVCYSRFTDRARKVMQLANQEAQRFNHEYVGTEHVLLAVVKVGDGVAAKIIKEHGIDPLKIRLEVEKLVKSGPAMVTMGKLPQTPRVKRAIELAANEATQLGVNYVGDEHILLGLLHDSESVAGSVLASLGMTLDRARSMLRELTCEPEQPAPAPAGDIPEWFVSLVKWIHDDGFGCGDENSRESATAIGQIAVIPKAWAKAEPEIARRVAEATKERDAETQKSRRLALEWGDKLTQRDAEIERLKAQLAKWESEPVGKMITELRDEERESKNADIKKLRSKIDELLNENAAQVEENDRLKAELAATTKPVELGSANIREIDGMKMIYLGDAQAAVRCERAARLTQRDAEIERLKAELAEARKPIPAGEPLATVEDFQSFLQRERAARLAAEKEVKKWQSDAYQLGVEKANLESQLSAAEQRLALTREAWRHRVVNTGKHHFRRYDVLTDADIDAAIAAHEKSKADAAGGGE